MSRTSDTSFEPTRLGSFFFFDAYAKAAQRRNLFSRGRALCVNIGAHIQRLCDLKAMTCALCRLSSMRRAEASSEVLLGWLGTHFISWAVLNSHIPDWQ